MDNFDTIINDMPELEAMLEGYGFIGALLVVIIGIAVAFFGTRLFKICITLVGTVFFGVIANTTIAPLIIDLIGESALELPFSLSALIGFVFAGIGYLLSYKLYKFAIFLFGCAFGYGIGTTVAVLIAQSAPDVEFFTSDVFLTVMPLILAILVGIITLFIFKFLYILATSLAGMSLACFTLGSSITTQESYLTVFGIVAIVLSIIAMIYQYKHSDNM